MTSDRAFDCLVVGGGAAGLATAIFAARRTPQASIAVLDGAKKVGAKILVSGGGRCNVTNRAVLPGDFWGGSSNIIKRILQSFSADLVVAFFEALGVTLHQEEHGKLFPDTNDAHSVLNALLHETEHLGIRILTDHRVTDIAHRDGSFLVTTPYGVFTSRLVVLATGGLSLPKTGSDGVGYALAQALGHSIVPTTPGLAPFVLDGDFHAALSGISQDVEITAAVEGEKPVRLTGALLWTHFGVSGPVVLDASRHWERATLDHRPVAVTVNMLPGSDVARGERTLLDLAASHPKAQLHNVLALLIPARVADALLVHLGIDLATPMAHLPKELRRELVQSLTAFPLPVRATRGYKYAEVTAGGVPLSEIDPATMESRRCPGLFLVGEILDVDGRIGGFNFQWSWSSGYVAGGGIAAALGKSAGFGL